MGPRIKGGNVELVEVITPDQAIPTGGSFEAALVVKNTASIIIGDPDGCSRAETPCRGVDGYCIRGVASLSGESGRESFQCINQPFTVIGANTERMSIVLEAPDSAGEYDVAAFIEGSRSGQRTSPLSTTITVSDDTVVNPPPGDGDDGGGDGGGIPDFFKQRPAVTAALALGGVVALDQALGE